MSITNGLTLPNSIVNGSALDATAVMANYDALLVGLNRALLDAGGGSGMNAFGSQIHNIGAGTASTDAVNLAQITGQWMPLAGGTMTGLLAATAGLTAPTQTAGDSSTNVATTAFVATSYAPLASPVLTGTPTAPTAAAGTNTAQLATTAFALAAAGGTTTPAASLAQTGYAKFANGLVIQWGVSAQSGSEGNYTVTFPIAFPHACFTAVTNSIGDGTISDNIWTQFISVTTTTLTVFYQAVAGGTLSSGFTWIAIGN